MKKYLVLLLVFNLFSSQAFAVQFAHRVYNANGDRIGTCRKDPYSRQLKLYDLNDKLVTNPTKYININDDNNFLFGATGHVIGTYNNTRVFIFHNTNP